MIKPTAIPDSLKEKIIFTIFMLAIYRVGVAVPIPGVDNFTLTEFFQSKGGGFFGLFNTFTGGALERFSVFALGIMPYISASIIFQLLQSSVPHLENLKKEGMEGRKKINQYTRYTTILIAIVQGYFIANLLMTNEQGGRPLVVNPYFGPMPFKLFAVITLTAGTCFLMWVGEQISQRGIGNGASLIIYAGIAAGIPSGAASLWKMLNTGEMGFVLFAFILIGILAVIGIIIFIEVAQRRIPIQYSQKGQGKMSMQQQGSHLPLKINMANVIPPIFASALLLFPATLSQFIDKPWVQSVQTFLTGPLYNILFIGLIVFFCFFYTEIVFNSNEVADNLKKHGGFVPGIRAGRSTASYVKAVLDRLTVFGSIYLSLVCILPNLLITELNLPFYFGGTSLLILVGVALDTSQRIQSHLLTARYDGLMKNFKVRSRRVQY